MTPEEIFQIWAPPESIWSPWAIPVPFAQLICTDSAAPLDLSDVEPTASAFTPAADLAVVVDLPGAIAIMLGLALAQRGFRPVPVIDGSPGPSVAGLDLIAPDQHVSETSVSAVDMRPLLQGLCQGAAMLQGLDLAPGASPAFLLDAKRLAEGQLVDQRLFDNRWKTFPQDYPSARFLQEHGISRVVLLQKYASQPKEDLAHVLLRWQEAGIRLEAYGTQEGGAPRPLSVNRPSGFRALWHRALALFGLRRGVLGGFGNWPHGTSGG